MIVIPTRERQAPLCGRLRNLAEPIGLLIPPVRTAGSRFASQPTRNRMSRMVFVPKRFFSFRKISDLETCSSS